MWKTNVIESSPVWMDSRLPEARSFATVEVLWAKDWTYKPRHSRFATTKWCQHECTSSWEAGGNRFEHIIFYELRTNWRWVYRGVLLIHCNLGSFKKCVAFGMKWRKFISMADRKTLSGGRDDSESWNLCSGKESGLVCTCTHPQHNVNIVIWLSFCFDCRPLEGCAMYGGVKWGSEIRQIP